MNNEELGNKIHHIFVTADSRAEIGRRARELLAKPVATREAVHAIRLTAAEIQSGHDRVKWAEGLIRQLPLTHGGRYSWLLNHGVGPEADSIREQWAKKVGMSPPVPNGPEVFAPPSPPPPEGLPSVEEISADMMRQSYGKPGRVQEITNNIADHCARVARALLEKHGREKRAIDGMTSNDIEIAIEIERSCNHKHIPCNPDFAEMASKVAYRLANTPAPVAPKVDADIKELAWTWYVGGNPDEGIRTYKTKDEYCDNQPNRFWDGWRAVAKQVKP